MRETWDASTRATCPQCGATIEVNPAFIAWCGQCRWNLQPYEPPRPTGLLGARYAEFGNALGRSLFEELKTRPSLQPRLTRSLLGAVVLASVVHLFTIVFFAGGVYLIITQWPLLPVVTAGVLLVLIAIYMAPRPAKYPKRYAQETAFPALYEAVDTAADAVGARPPDMIVLDLQFNASYRRVGWRQRTVLTLGLPLLAIMDEREFVALIGHEMAHEVNGDATRGFFVGSAIDALARWYEVLYPVPDRLHVQAGFAALAMLIMRPFQIALSQVPRASALLLLHLLWRDSQRAEYLADDLSAHIAGTEAVISLLGKLQLRRIAEVTVQDVAVESSGQTILSLLSTRCKALPLHERKRLDAVGRLEASRLDNTHPPTGFRLALLEARPISTPSVHLLATSWRAIEDEIAGTEPGATKQMVDEYRSRLYRH